MRVVGYIRVSTDRQADEGFGLAVQEQEIRRWCREHGHRLACLYRDEGVSGSNGLDTRLGLADALDALRNGSARGLVVYRLDRLARDVVLQEQLLAECRKINVEVFSCSSSESDLLRDDPSDPSRKMVRVIMGSVADYERSMIGLRLSAGRRRKAQSGGYAYGAPPFGWAAIDGDLVVDESETATVRRIAELRAVGTSLRAIAQQLEAEGHAPRRGLHWHPKVIRAIIARMGTRP